MSSSLPEHENAAPSGSLNNLGGPGGRGEEDMDVNKRPLRRAPPRAKSASLLTQALSTNYEADELDTLSNPSSKSPERLADPTQHLFSSFTAAPKDFEQDGLSRKGSAEPKPDTMAISVATSTGDMPSSRPPPKPPSSFTFNLHDMSDLNFALSNHRDLLTTSRGRGTSLERTDKEKRTHEFPNGPIINNPGDTGMSGPTTPQSPTTPESISTNPPTDGLRARYRSWRDARPAAAERAWSIGHQGSNESGEVESSIKEALAGVEPNSRSRKASHSLRFFKEGLPDDKTKKRDHKSKGQLKDGSSRGKGANFLDGIDSKKESETNSCNASSAGPSGIHALDASNSTTKPGNDPNRVTPQQTSEAGYFDIVRDTDTVSEDQVKALPAQLLADIRKNHNLTPGASKGSSFSRSIPVTESEKSLSVGGSKPVTNPTNSRKQSSKSDDSDVSQSKTDDDDNNSGEEEISSAVFVPHKTAHESSDGEEDESPITPGQPSKRPYKVDVPASQQWLEEHAVPSREVDEKYISKDSRSRSIRSPVVSKPPTPYTEKEQTFPSLPETALLEHDTHEEGDESGLTDDPEDDTTPTGSPKHEQLALGQHPELHDHQQEQQEPIEAIQLIPYSHQVGGHTTMWKFSKRAVCKQLNSRENEFYEKVERFHPKLLKFLPRYIGVLNVNISKPRQKPSLKGGEENEAHDTADQSKLGGETTTNEQASSTPGHTRVISQSLQSASIPIPTVAFADNRHIIPKSFLRPNWAFGEQRPKSDGDIATQRAANQAQPPLPGGEFTFRQDRPNVTTDTLNGSNRPTLEDKHSDSWGSTIKNKDLRNKVFDEAFLQQPIPIMHHRKPASQRRSLPNRHGAILRASNSESSLKAAQQSQTPSSSQPAEDSMHRRAMKAAAEQRKMPRSVIAPLTAIHPVKEENSTIEGGDSDFDEKAGTSAPEPELSKAEDNAKGKRPRRYSSGGLRRKPSEVAHDRGNLKYFEEADDAGYKGDAEEEELFAMDPEPVRTGEITTEKLGLNGGGVDAADPPKGTLAGTMLPAAPTEPAMELIDIPRPVNPKEAQTQSDSRVQYFLLLEDLTAGMRKPCIMDLKMGTRQYGVEANEKKQKSQRQKCAATTSKELGVRVCGLQVWDVKLQKYIFLDKYFGRDLKAGRDFQNALQRFLYDGVDYSSILRHIPAILKKLAELDVLIRSLAGYRFYAASLLMYYDGDTAEEGESDSTATEKDVVHRKKNIDFKMADFANCVVKEEFSTSRPCPPRHPDLPDKGFLKGLRTLRRYFLAIQEDVRRKEMGYSKDELMTKMDNTAFDGAAELDDDEDGLSF